MPPSPATSAPPLPRRRTLHGQFVQRLLWPLVLAFVLATGTTATVNYHSEKAQHTALREQTLRIFARTLIKPLWDCDGATARGIVDTLAQQPLVQAVRLHDSCGDNVIASESALDTILPAQDPAHTNQLAMPLHHRDEQGRDHQVGHLSVQFTPFSMAQAAMQNLGQQLAVFAAMLVVVLLGAALVFRHLIGRPLARFRQAIHDQRTVRSHAGPADAGERLRNDELSDVVQAYDALLEELDSRFARQSTLAHCARSLLATAAGQQSPLPEVLAQVLRTTGADRIYLAENLQTTATTWQAQARVVAGAPWPDAAQALVPARWRSCFEERSGVLGTVQDLPEPERQQLIAAGVRSVAALPVWGQGQWFGYLCVQDLQQQRRWSDSERVFLHTVADMIGAFLESRQHTRTLDRAIVQLRDSERALQHRARHDPLTGLGNRVVLEEALGHALAHAQAGEDLHGYVLLLDLDGFKPVNDTHGHAAGDALLQTVAQRLQACLRSTDTVTRLGGDEFVIVAQGKGPQFQLDQLLAKVTAAVEAPVDYLGQALQVGASIGAARFPEAGRSSAELLVRADQAMYAAKQAKRLAR